MMNKVAYGLQNVCFWRQNDFSISQFDYVFLSVNGLVNVTRFHRYVIVFSILQDLRADEI